jgi:GntR family transcriptional regulator / MocR family aminotransferase
LKGPFLSSWLYHSGMPRASSRPPDLVFVNPRPDSALAQWLCDEVRSAILDGRLRRGMRLPATRELARHYGLSRGTVVTAFEELHSEGYLEGKVGAGTYVNALLPDDLLYAGPVSGKPKKVNRRSRTLSRFALRLETPPPGRRQPARAFRAGEPALDAFPLAAWARIASRRLRRATRSLLASGDSRGYQPLREAVADYLGSARGVRCTPDQVIIVSGIQQALELTARLVLDPGDRVWVEDPCYFAVPAVFRALQARIVPVSVDRDGLDVTEGERRCPVARLAYVTPAHQFPLGSVMALDRRLALLNWARRAGGLIFEDDYDSEYRYAGRPIPAIQGLDEGGSVVFSGSFGKILLPSLRLGYLVAPSDLVDKFAAARNVTDRFSPVIEQAVMYDFITEGHFGRHVRRMRELYAGRLAVLREAVSRRLDGLLRLQETEAGIQTVGWLGEGLEARAVADAAAAADVEVMPIDQFSLRSSLPEGLLLGFAAVDEPEILRGVEKLARVLEGCLRTRRRRSEASVRNSVDRGES